MFWYSTTMYLWVCICGAFIWIDDIWIRYVFGLFHQFGVHLYDNKVGLLSMHVTTCESDVRSDVFEWLVRFEFI